MAGGDISPLPVFVTTNENLDPVSITNNEEEIMYIKFINLTAQSTNETDIATLPAEAPSGWYEVKIPGGVASYAYNVQVHNQGSGAYQDSILSILYQTTPCLLLSGTGLSVLSLNYDSETNSGMWSVPNGTTLVQMRCFFKHVQGIETPLVSLTGLNVFTQGNYVKTVTVRQLA